MMEQSLRTRLQAARWLLERVATKPSAERRAYLRAETDDGLLIDLVEGLLESEGAEAGPPSVGDEGTLIASLAMGPVDAEDLLREINGIPRLLGDFEVIRPLGSGGMGSVFLAEHRDTGRLHAVKVAIGESREARSVKALLGEAALMSELADVEGIPDALPAEVITRDGETIAYHPREFVRGDSVESWLRTKPVDHGSMMEVAMGLCRIVEACHLAGVTHGDIKTSNVLVESGSGRTYLIDFGLALAVGDGEFVERVPIGHLAYVAPEVKAGVRHDPRLADQFSLGITLFEMLATPETETEIGQEGDRDSIRTAGRIGSSDLPPAITGVLQRMTQLEPGARFPSMSLVREALQEAVVAGATTSRERGFPRKPVLRFAIAAGVVATLSASLWSIPGVPVASSQGGEVVSSPWADLRMALTALDSGEVALASDLLSRRTTMEDPWLARHLRARLLALYAGAFVPAPVDPDLDSGAGLEPPKGGEAAVARTVRDRSSNRVVFEVDDGFLDVDLTRGAAAKTLSGQAVPGSMFMVAEGDVGWLDTSGSIVMRSMVGLREQVIPAPSGVRLDRASVASDDWGRLVIVDGGPEVHLVGIGPRLGTGGRIQVDGGVGLDGVLSLGRERFLLHDSSGGCWILDPDERLRAVDAGGPVLDMHPLGESEVLLTVQHGSSSRLQRVSRNGRLVSGARLLPPGSRIITTVDEHRVLVDGPKRLEILHLAGEMIPSTTVESPGRVRSAALAGSRCLLLGGDWGGIWVVDLESGTILGYLDTGGRATESILGSGRLGDVFTQDERGCIRRIPA